MASLQVHESASPKAPSQCGVGLSLQCHNSRFYVAEVLPICSGFFEHSIQPGDEIQKVGNLDVQGLTLQQLDRALLGEAGTFVSVLLQRHSQLLETTLLRIDQPRATIVKQMLAPASLIPDDADKAISSVHAFDADNANLGSTVKSIQLQLSGANLILHRDYDSCCTFDAITAAQSEIQTLRHTLTDR